ncbi:hypothetical protein QKG26_gp037 [Chelonid alphaherpesvirus 5]|uniref:Uncharacterized protein n=1 Tax=Chelonid alphaherpesvirus 5 TaxID=702736 RepID=V5NXC3_9ALPH|nr:hypothetical protein QKG26_gp037 [Chelonid alphaherpesvirus 5]AHA93324.1 hypothetical protein [Chelonid alphaherpesvirus 5]
MQHVTDIQHGHGRFLVVAQEVGRATPQVQVAKLGIVVDPGQVAVEPALQRQLGAPGQTPVALKLGNGDKHVHGEGENQVATPGALSQMVVQAGRVPLCLLVRQKEPRPARQVGGVHDVSVRLDELIQVAHGLVGDREAEFEHLEHVGKVHFTTTFVVDENRPVVAELHVAGHGGVANQIRKDVFGSAHTVPLRGVLEIGLERVRLRG